MKKCSCDSTGFSLYEFYVELYCGGVRFGLLERVGHIGSIPITSTKTEHWLRGLKHLFAKQTNYQRLHRFKSYCFHQNYKDGIYEIQYQKRNI